MNIQTYEDNKLKEMNVNINKIYEPAKRLYSTKELELFMENDKSKNVTKQVTDSVSLYDELGRSRWENLLPTVEIEEDREWRSDFVRKWNNLIYEMEDERMRMDDTGEEYLVEFYREVGVHNGAQNST